MRVLVAVLAVLLFGLGCSHLPGMGSAKTAASPSPSAVAAGTPLAKAAGQLDAEVPMPAGFPTDVPVYPKARLTAGASFTSSGQIAWGMEWETTDAAAAVQDFYLKQLNQGDWKLTVSNASSAGPAFAGTFARKSNTHDTGTIAVNADQGLTVIALSFLSSG